MGKVISFLNNKGGVGKTMSAFNVGVFWAGLGKKILFIDLDSQANLTSMISAYDTRYESGVWENSIEDAFVMGPKLCSLPIYGSRYQNVDFVPADLKLSNFDVETSSNTMKTYLLQDLIAGVKDKYDYIILDCPPALGGIIMNALVASDGMVISTLADGKSVEGMHMIINLYNSVIEDKRLNPYLKFLGCIITRIENDTLNRSLVSQIEEELGVYVIKPYIHKSTKLAQASSINRDIFTHDPEGRGASEYKEVATEILLRIEK